jgi:hypothetical protein
MHTSPAAPADAQRELKRVRRRMQDTRAELRDVRAELEQAHAELEERPHPLPPAVDEYFKDRDGFRLERRAKLHVVRE